jgi:outer membrane protein OmpA-like peptidoglycan-associated protein
MKYLVISLAIIIFSGRLLADETGGKVYFGIKGGNATYSGDIDDMQFASYYDFNTGYWFTDHIGIGFNYGKGFLHAAKDQNGNELYFKTWIWNYSFLLKFKILPRSPLNPYITAGYSMIDFNPKGRDGYRLPNRAAEKYEKNSYAIPMGIGLTYFLAEFLALDFEAIYHYSGTDYIDDLKKGSKHDGWTTAAIGLSLYFGKPKDTDGDGIIDKNDLDPLHAEDFDGFQDSDGMPEPDNDKDGVIDLLDKAPLDPEDRDGFKDKDGIPDPDNDADGITDENDNCPGTDENLNTKEDMDGFEDSDGCPDPDNDGDGIPDDDDECPNDAEVVNGYDDDDGCPDKKPEIAVEKGKAIVLEGVNFASGSANLSETSLVILEKVFNTLNENPEIEVEIRGYTDNIGNYENNVGLSQRRADSVKQYLTQKGIQGSRIITKGFGPADPIAPNDTREGRGKNRRIEFFRIR